MMLVARGRSGCSTAAGCRWRGITNRPPAISTARALTAVRAATIACARARSARSMSLSNIVLRRDVHASGRGRVAPRRSRARAPAARTCGSHLPSVLPSSLAADHCGVRHAHARGRDTPAPLYSSEVETMLRQLFVCCLHRRAHVRGGAAARARRHRARGQRARQRARDSARARAAARLAVVTITATPVQRAESRQAVAVSPEDIARAPATSPWEMLRQTAGVEVHIQGQGPGFASDASVRGFSSDHSTDLALWIDGVPVNEPVNGHAEGYNDWSLIFPQAIQDLDVIKGPTSALFGEFRVFRHRERAHARSPERHARVDQRRIGGTHRGHRRSPASATTPARPRTASSARATCTRVDGARTATTISARDTCVSCTTSRRARRSMAAWSSMARDGTRRDT